MVSSELPPHQRSRLRMARFRARAENRPKFSPPDGDEYLDLVSEDDNRVIGRALRSRVYKEGVSNFRTINAFLRNTDGQLWIPRRASGISHPNVLDFSVGEHVQSGESYHTAFRRGLREELRMKIGKKRYIVLGKMTPNADGVSSFMKVHEIASNSAPRFNPNDFSGGSWIHPDELREMIAAGTPAKSDLILVLNKFYPSAKLN